MDKLEWVILITDNYPLSRTFYKETLGFILVREMEKEEFAQFQMNNCFLAIYGRSEVNKLIGKEYVGKAGGAIYTFGEDDDVDTTYKELMAKGVHFIKSPQTQPWGQRTAYFTDPDGHIWEIQKWITGLSQ